MIRFYGTLATTGIPPAPTAAAEPVILGPRLASLAALLVCYG